MTIARHDNRAPRGLEATVRAIDPGQGARERRRAAAQRWRPAKVRLLLVDEAPPAALDRYFYFEDVTTHDALFRYVVEAVTGERPTRDKPPYLEALRQRGVFLIDLCPDPFRRRRDAMPAAVPDLLARVEELAPERVTLIGAEVYDTAYGALSRAGTPVADVRLPYPGNGQQRRFLDGFAAAVEAGRISLDR
jgi:hypothetical protein